MKPNSNKYKALDKVKKTLNLAHYMGQYLGTFERHPENEKLFIAVCPFNKKCGNKLSINSKLQLYHCFGCEKGGDLITFYMDYLGLTFMESVAKVYEVASYQLLNKLGLSQGREIDIDLF